MKRFSEMPPRVVGVRGVFIVLLVIVASLSAGKFAAHFGADPYLATFSQSTGLREGDSVRVSGLDVGEVRSVKLDRNQVLVEFTADGVALGSLTRAAIKTETALGGRFLEITPAGEGNLPSGGIPLARTKPAYPLTDALQDTTRTAQELDSEQLAKSFDVIADTLSETPDEVRDALDGVRRLSSVISRRDDALASLLTHADGVTELLAQRSTQIATILSDGSALLKELEARRDVIDTLMSDITALTKQISGLTEDNRKTLRPALTELRKTLAVLTKNRANLATTIKGLPAFARSLGEAVGGGPFFYGYLQNLVPTSLAPVLPGLFGVGTGPGEEGTR